MKRVVTIGEGETRYVTSTLAAELIDCSDDPTLYNTWEQTVRARVKAEEGWLIKRQRHILGSWAHQLIDLCYPSKYVRAQVRNDRTFLKDLQTGGSAKLSYHQLHHAESLLPSPTPITLTREQAPALAAFLVDSAADALSEPPAQGLDWSATATQNLDEAYRLADTFEFSLSQACLESIRRVNEAEQASNT